MKIPKSFLLLSGAVAGLTLLSGERDGTCTPTKTQLILRQKIAQLNGGTVNPQTKEELLADIERLRREGKISDQEVAAFKKSLEEQNVKPGDSPNSEVQARARQALQQKLAELNKGGGGPAAPPSINEAQAKAQKILDEQRAAPKKPETAPPPVSNVAKQSVQPKPAEPAKELKATAPPSNTEAQAKAQKILDGQRATAKKAEAAPPPATAIARQPAQPKPVEPTKEQKAVVTAPSTSTATQAKAPKAVAEKPAPVKKAEAAPPPASTVARQSVQPKPAEPARELKAAAPPASSNEAQAKAQKALEELRAKEQTAVVTAPTKTKTQVKAPKALAEKPAPVKKTQPTPPPTKTVSKPALAQKADAARTPEKTNVIPQSTTGTLTPELEAKARELLRAQIAATQAQGFETPAPQAPAPAATVAAPAPVVAAPVVAAAAPAVATPAPVVAAPPPALATTAPAVEAPAANPEAQAKALEVLRRQEAELKAGVTSDTSPQIRALRLKIAEERGVLRPGEAAQIASGAVATSPAGPAGFGPLPVPSSNKVGLERLAELTELYKADRISPYDYHHERAKIVSTL